MTGQAKWWYRVEGERDGGMSLVVEEGVDVVVDGGCTLVWEVKSWHLHGHVKCIDMSSASIAAVSTVHFAYNTAPFPCLSQSRS